MEIKITEQQYNALLKRREVTFEVEHAQTKGTPSRLEMRSRLAELLKTSPEVVYIKRVETKSGTMIAVGEANAYDGVDQAKLIEPAYIIARNTPKEKKEAAEKTEEMRVAPEKLEKTAEKEK